MRYAIGCTIISKNTKLASPPYLIGLSNNNTFVSVVDSFKNLKNQYIIVCHSVEEGKDMLTNIKNTLISKDIIHLYLLKIDSLKFPYKITNNYQIRKLENNQIVHFERVKELK